jgi:hypothetical protein
MKIKKISENFEISIEDGFSFLYTGEYGKLNVSIKEKERIIKFLESLNLTEYQKSTLSDIIQSYGYERYNDGYSAGIESTQAPY